MKKEQQFTHLQGMRAMQHFFYYIDVNHIKEKNIWGTNLTEHFLSKLRICQFKTKSEYIRSDAVVSWIQEMSSDNQQILLDYILKYHMDKW